MAIDLTKFLKGRSLKAADFNFNDTTDMVEIKTDATSAVGAAIAAAAPDASATVRGLVNLTDLQVLGAGRKIIDGIHVGRGNPAAASPSTNTAVGLDAGALNTASNQTATGRAAGQNNTGANQTATGRSAGYNNTGDNQTATGFNAGQYNTGANQTATGYAAGYNNTGANQTATGRSAGQNNTGANQTATGYAAGQYNTGAGNTFYGYNAGGGNGALLGTVTLTPSSATAGTVSPALPASVVGTSLPVYISGYDWRVLTFTSATEYTTLSGPGSGTWTASVYEGIPFNNITVLGAGANPTASNQVMLGNTAVTEVRTSGTYYGTGYVTTSDATLKEHVTEIDPAKALAFRNGLRWVRYEMFSEEQVEIVETVTEEVLKLDDEGNPVILPNGKPKTERVEVEKPTGRYEVKRNSHGFNYGLIAQEVQALAAQVGAFDDVVIKVGEYFDLDAKGTPKKDKKGNVIKLDRFGLDYDAINVIVMAGEKSELLA